ncbi:hypothetical protein PF005_g1877 [Phytophthora fragariae]|uniref:Uncharacterized protein n=1 Tax=Phytophthora fragariae TaxID=53985 RepID=A0A6A3US83_9STRA|nr:hypothetical protein PF009_g2678 [Phytophthora fragariae]KAE9027909.1 hypothetical protein PF011_g1818 [Phytophthora fragariae]KAE9135490.1 hypothetical protein PF007_g2538 [Phytophthora fragariae]KAE9154457.1 hypothetical protein PF006_g1513 [Phytophthora fragariae]KAE9234464.1 hypothetical protein PF005_g1877 [Phytophthora fragariae]
MQRGVLHADARPLRRRSQSTYQQRYFVCDCHFRPGGAFYLNHTGLMWENAVELGAMLRDIPYFGDEVVHVLGEYSQVTTFNASLGPGSVDNCVPSMADNKSVQ